MDKITNINTNEMDTALMNLIPDLIENVPLQKQKIRIRVTKVYDGDTMTIVFFHNQINYSLPLKLRMRIKNIDAPEIKGNTDSLEHTVALLVRDLVASKIENKVVWGIIDRWDNYGGRVDGDLFFASNPTESGNNIDISLSKWLLDNELVHFYSGKSAREKWTDEELLRIKEQIEKRKQ